MKRLRTALVAALYFAAAGLCSSSIATSLPSALPPGYGQSSTSSKSSGKMTSRKTTHSSSQASSPASISSLQSGPDSPTKSMKSTRSTLHTKSIPPSSIVASVRSSSASTGSIQSPTRGSSTLATCTVTSSTVITSTYTPLESTVTVTTLYTDWINGDDIEPYGGTYTDYVPSFSTISDSATSSTTFTVTPSAPAVTSTVFPPASFSPVDDTLQSLGFYYNPGDNPGGTDPVSKRDLGARRHVQRTSRAVHHKQSNCATVTSTSTAIATGSVQTTTITSTITTVLVAYPNEHTTIPIDQFTTWPPTTVFITTPATTTVFASTTTVTETASSTIPATTTTLYAACSQDNWANTAYMGPDVPQYYPLTGVNVTEDVIGDVQGQSYGAYDCCVRAVGNGGFAVWAYDPTTTICYSYHPRDDSTCVQSQHQFALLADHSQTFDKAFIVGNGYCGEYSSFILSQ